MFWYLIEPPSEWMSDLFVDVVAVVTINILMKHTVIYFMTTTANNKTKMSTYLIKAARVGSGNGNGNGNGNSILTKYSILISSWRSSQPTATMIKKEKKNLQERDIEETKRKQRQQQLWAESSSISIITKVIKKRWWLRNARREKKTEKNTHTHSGERSDVDDY